MTGVGRGRARGRAATPQQQQQSQATPGTGSHPGGRGGPSYAQMGGGPAVAPQPQAAKPPASSAWGPPPGASARATHRVQSSQPGDVTAAMAQVSLGKATSASGPMPAGSHSGGNGNGGTPVGRGAIRGRQKIGDDRQNDSRKKTRPDSLADKRGSVGRSLGLLANYFPLSKVPDQHLRQYRVDISPEEDRTGERKFLLRAFKEQLKGYIFDGTVLYTTAPITSAQSKTVTWTSSNRDNSQNFQITIREVGEVQCGDFAYVQIFNILLRTCIFALDLKMVGRDYFDPAANVRVPQYRLELWPGYKTSIRQHETSILMCVEITHKVMRMETVLDILRDCVQKGGSYYQKEFVKEVVGVIILTKYNNKTYRIDDVAWELNPSKTFKFRDEEISFAEYMKRKYQINITDLKQPLLVSRAKARDVRAGMSEVVNLIPEVCYCTGLTDNMRNNFQLMKALGQHTKVSPDGRINKLQSFNKRLQESQQAQDQLKRFGMALGKDLVKVPGRVLPEENILFHNRKVGTGPAVDWTREFRSSHLLLARNISEWVVVCPSKSKRDANAFVDMLKRNAAPIGVKISDPRYVEIQRDGSGEYVQALNQVMDSSQPQLIMCCVPNNRGDRYAAIKKKCCIDRPVPTQVIVCKNLNDPKKSMSIATKVAVQINCKVGGAAWAVDVPMDGLMVVGFDVCHDTSSKSRSFGAMVGSLDKPMSRYFSAVTPHQSGEELSINLALNVVKAVRKYQEHNSGPPTRIIIYRDGVGEGQIPFVVDHEVKAVEAKLAEAYASYDVPLKLSYIIVTKRINTRLFTVSNQNPPPGCVVDDVVTDPEKYDFFLVSQSVREGTVSPTGFNIIHDTVGLGPDKMQRLSYKLCHMYFNWSGTVRVPAPCQYAHKLAFLVGQALNREPNNMLEDLLYFL